MCASFYLFVYKNLRVSSSLNLAIESVCLSDLLARIRLIYDFVLLAENIVTFREVDSETNDVGKCRAFRSSKGCCLLSLLSLSL